MPVSTDVNLPKSLAPVFPNRCVACGADQPESTYRTGTSAIGWWTLAFWSFGPRFTAEVPACTTCRVRMRNLRWLQLAVNIVFAFAGVGAAFYLLQWYQGPFKRWLVLGIALIALMPVILWETFFPRPFAMTAYAKTVDYEFRDGDYAYEFAALNRTDTEE